MKRCWITVYALMVVTMLFSMPMPTMADGEWNWQHPLPQGCELTDVWGASDTEVFAVGGNGALLYFDGTDWETMVSPTARGLNGVWGSSAGDVFAVGIYGTILHFDGNGWEQMSSPSTSGLNSVWGSSGSDVFAVGYGGTILHYNGASWVQMPSPTTSTTLTDIWGSSGSDVFAVSDSGAILHYDGTAWTEMVSGSTDYLTGIWGSASNDIFAVGTNDSTILHYNGSNWSEMYRGNAVYFKCIWGSSGNDILAAGSSGKVFHYNGSSWVQLSMEISGNFNSIWSSSADHVIAVGGYGRIVSYDGSQWTEMSSGTTYNFEDIWGSSGNDIFAVGSQGVIMHNDGSGWNLMSSGTTAGLLGVWGSSADDVFAVGYNGTILHYGGGTWTAMTSPTTLSLMDIWGSAPDDVFAVGAESTILHYDGLAWTVVQSYPADTINAIWGSSGSDIFAVSYYGDVYHFDGSTWTRTTTAVALYGVWGTSGDDVFAVGNNGRIVHYDGNTWSVMTSNTTTWLRGVWGTSGSDVFAVGQTTTIYHYDGNAWTRMTDISNKNLNWLKSIWSSPAKDMYAVGAGGAILHRGPDKVVTLSVPQFAHESDGILNGQGVVNLSVVAEDHLEVALATSDFSEITVPATVTVLPGESSAVFDLTIMDDNLLDGSQAVQITASVEGFQSDTHAIQVHDNETAVITVTVPAQAAEGDNVLAGQGVVTISQPVDDEVTVTLNSDDATELEVPAAVVVPAGQNSATFDLTVLNDSMIDGAQTVTVTASVNGWTSGSDTIDIADDESTQLTVALPAAVNEGDGVLAYAGAVTISAPYGSDLTIHLSSSDPAKVSVTASIILRAGQSVALFSLTVIDDAVSAGSQVVTISATAAGFVSDSNDLLVQENDLHHFAISTIQDGQAGVPFAVTITAKDMNGNTIGGFTGPASLRFEADAGPVAMEPATTGSFANGQWTGNVTVLAIGSEITLIADDGQGNTTAGNPFSVVSGPLDHFELSPVSGPQPVGIPFMLTVTAKDALGFTDASFNGSVDLSGTNGADAESIIGTGTSAWTFPMYTYYHDARTQVIYTADELGGAGTIKAIALDITTLPGQTMNNWTIRMKHTGKAYYTSPYAWESGWTTVYQNNETVTATGWRVFNFQTPFEYNGSDHLMIDFSFNNSSWTSSGNCRYTNKSQVRSLYYYTDSGYGDPLNWSGSSPSPRTSYNVPNIKILSDSSVEISPETGGPFTGGIWTGNITVLETAAGVQIRADDVQGHTGTSNAFDVIMLDTDGDGLADGIETAPSSCTLFNNPDTDGDGVSDGSEDTNQNGTVDAGETNPCMADTDGDGLNDGAEDSYGTDPLLGDTDNDGIGDGDEVLVYGTLADEADTDADGIDDGDELTYWGADWNADPDADGLANIVDPDADNDGHSDGVEISQGSDPGSSSSRPLDHFEVSTIVSPQAVGTPFAVTLTAKDSYGYTVENFSGEADISGWTNAGPGGPPVVITECDLGSDFIEIQNVSGQDVDTSGWRVAVSNSYSSINSVNSVYWYLPSSMSSGQVLYRTDYAENYWGSNIYWNPGSSYTGWAMIIDQNGDLIDFVAWGWSAAAIASMAPVIGGNTVTISDQFSGDGVSASGSGSIQRQGQQDTNTSSDFIWLTQSKGLQNSGMSVPFPGGEAVVLISPDLAQPFIDGVWTGEITVQEPTVQMVLRFETEGGFMGESNVFDVQ